MSRSCDKAREAEGTQATSGRLGAPSESDSLPLELFHIEYSCVQTRIILVKTFLAHMREAHRHAVFSNDSVFQ